MALPNALGTGGCTIGGEIVSWTAQLSYYMIGVFKLNWTLQVPEGYNKPVKAFSLS